MTQNPPRSPDPLVTDWLLSALYGRLYLSAEMGVLACLEYPAARYAEFVNGHIARPALALAEVLRLAAAEGGLATAGKPLEGVVVWGEILVAAMGALGGFRSLPPAELRDAADRFGMAWFSLRRCIEELAAALATEPSYLRQVSSARDQAVRETLDALCAELEQERGRAAP
jgi:hypothetical protein